MQKKLVLFDFDGTLTRRDSLLVFFQFTHGVFPFYFNALRAVPILFLWKIGVLKAANSKQLVFNIFYKNWTKEKLQQQGEAFANKAIPTILFKNALDLVRSYQEKGYETVLVSASFSIYLQPFCDRYGLRYVCTELAYENGIYKGHFATKNCNYQEKVNRLEAIFNKKDFDEIVAFGNSNGDCAMLKWATKPHFLRRGYSGRG